MCSCSGSCNCNSTTIPRGPQGVPGPTGDKGDKGDTGAAGGAGSPGTAATINVVPEIITVPFGDPASVQNLGSDSAANFEFTIPAGEPGYVSLERIKSDIANYTGGISVNFTELDIDGRIISLTITCGTEDATGVFGAAGFSISDGITTTSLFSAGSTGPNYGILPAKIKFDRTPTLSPSGYESNEYINFVTAELKISRVSSTGARITGVIYGYNTENQDTFGLARFPQKIWHLNTGFSYPNNFNIIVSVTDDGSGTAIGLLDILRYNTIS
jgi:hypothetical protein